MIAFDKDLLLFDDYFWDIDRRYARGCHDIGNEPLIFNQGYEVLLFAITFLELYQPCYTLGDLQAVEYLIRFKVPRYITAKNSVAFWIANQKALFVAVKFQITNSRYYLNYKSRIISNTALSFRLPSIYAPLVAHHL